MSIIKVHKQKNYTTISNRPLNDPNLSMKARGIWATLMSKPEDWQVYVSQLVKTSKDGKTAIYSGLKELKEAGYIEHVFIREKGKVVRGEYIVYEDPIDIKKPVNRPPEPDTENLNTVSLNDENPPLLNTDVKIKTNDDQTEPPPKTGEPDISDLPLPPPSFSEKQLAPILAGLMSLVPEAFQTSSVEHVIKTALTAHSEGYIKSAILYTTDHSTGQTTAKYKAYLGRCIEGGWAYGYQSEAAEELSTVKKSFEGMPEDVLKLMADAGNSFAMDELTRRKK